MSEPDRHSSWLEDQLTIKTILVVDDDADMRESILQALRTETPYLVMPATDGFEVLKIIGRLKLDLFVIDYQLPDMDGIELYDHLHATVGLEHVPALIMGANVPRAELEKRSVSYISKPFEIEELIQIIQKLLAEQSISSKDAIPKVEGCGVEKKTML
jgi:CheY-like chemotaxis protein